MPLRVLPALADDQRHHRQHQCAGQAEQRDGDDERDTVISTRLLSGRTLIHVVADRYPGDDFEPIHPTLDDVYFATIAGRHNDLAGNC